MPRMLASLVVAAMACGDDPVETVAPDPVAARVALDDPATACREVAPMLDAMARLVAEAESIPADPALYELAARLAVTRRRRAIAGHELALLDAELDAADVVLQPASARTAREAAHRRAADRHDELSATEAALGDEAARARDPRVAAPDGPERVLRSIIWRDAAGHVRRHRAACAGAPGEVDVAALRDFTSGMTLLERDGHDIATRSLALRILSEDPGLPGTR